VMKALNTSWWFATFTKTTFTTKDGTNRFNY